MLPLIVALGNDGADMMIAEPLADARVAVPLVSGEPVRPHARTTERPRDRDSIHDGLDPRGVVDLTRRHFDRDRKPLAVGDQVELAPESASRAAERVVLGLVRV